MYVILADGTKIENCTNSTTSNSVFAVRNSYSAAGAVRDQFTAENAKVITVYDDEDQETTSGADLVLIPGCKITEDGENFVCEIDTRVKTNEEKMQDEIAELQEAILN